MRCRLLSIKTVLFIFALGITGIASAEWAFRPTPSPLPSVGRSTALVAGQTVHTLWRIHYGNRFTADLRGFNAAGTTVYAVDTSAAPMLAPSASTLTQVKGANTAGDFVVSGGGVTLLMSSSGALIWRLTALSEVADAYRLPGGDTLLFDGVRTVIRVNGSGTVIDGRWLEPLAGAGSPVFDRDGRILVQNANFVLERLDPNSLEPTAQWTRIDAPARAVTPAADGGSLVLTSTNLLRLDAAGAIVWQMPFAGVAANSETAYRLIETSGGDWLVYESEAWSDRLTGVSSSGQIRYTRSAPKDEMAYLAADGSAFLNAKQLFRLNASDGTASLVANVPWWHLPARVATLAGQWITVSSVPDALTVISLNSAGSTVWSRSGFTIAGTTTTSACEEGAMKQIGAQLFVKTDGDIPAPPGNPSNSIVASSSAMHTLTSSGTATSSVDLAINHCLPALDADATRYVIDSDIGSTKYVRAVRADGTELWRRAAPTFSNGTRKTVLLGSSVVAAIYSDAVVGYDRTTGTPLWTVSASVQSSVASPDSLYVWVLTGDRGLVRIDSTGALLTAAGTPLADANGNLRMRATSGGGLVVASESSVRRYDGNGTILWTQSIAPAAGSVARVAALATTDSGDVVVGGCDNDNARGSLPFLARFSSAGVLQHRLTIPSSDKSCVDAVLGVAGGRVAVATYRADGPTVSIFNADGTEAARRRVFAADPLRDWTFSDLTLFGTQIVVLGTELNAATGALTATVAALDHLGETPGVRLRLLTNPPAVARYDQAFSLTVGLTDAQGNVVYATRPVRVFAAKAPSSPAFVSSAECLIGVGESSCVLGGLRGHPNKVRVGFDYVLATDAAVQLFSDGARGLTTPTFQTIQAPTTTTITLRSAQPLAALKSVRYTVTVSTGANHPFADAFPVGCGPAITSATGVVKFECTATVRAPTTTLSHTFDSISNAYAPSTGTLTVNVQKSPVILRLLPTNPTSVRAGEYFSIGVYVLLPNGRDAWPDASVVSLQYQSGASACAAMAPTGNTGNGATGPHWCPNLRETHVGSSPLRLDVAESQQILGTSAVVPLTVVAAAGLQGTVWLNATEPTPTICGTTPGLNCTVSRTGATNANIFCDAPQNWTGQVFVQAPGYRYQPNGTRLGPLSAIESLPSRFSMPSPACSVDINGDSSLDIADEGMFILRTLFGVTDASAYVNLGHSCATRSHADALAAIHTAVSDLDWDFDGDQQVTALTDGLLLLRLMLGFTGDALTQGAINPAGTRTSSADILNYVYTQFYARCGPLTP